MKQRCKLASKHALYMCKHFYFRAVHICSINISAAEFVLWIWVPQRVTILVCSSLMLGTKRLDCSIFHTSANQSNLVRGITDRLPNTKLWNNSAFSCIFTSVKHGFLTDPQIINWLKICCGCIFNSISANRILDAFTSCPLNIPKGRLGMFDCSPPPFVHFQGCYLIPLYCLLSCSAYSDCSFCFFLFSVVVFCLLAHSLDLFRNSFNIFH